MNVQTLTLAALSGFSLAQPTPADDPVAHDRYPVLDANRVIEGDGSIFGYDGFGFEVAIRDNKLLVSEPSWSDGPQHPRGNGWGAIWIYSPVTGDRIGSYTPVSDSVQDFGREITTDEDFTAISGWIDGDSVIQLYEEDSTIPVRSLSRDVDDEFNSIFSTAQHGDRIVACYRTPNPYNSGIAVLFDAKTGDELAEFPCQSRSNVDARTQNIAMSDDVFALRTDDGEMGSRVDVYDLSTFELKHSLRPSEPNPGFGVSIAINDEYIAVATYWVRVPDPRSGKGIVELFDRESGDSAAVISPTDIVGDEFFANSIAINDRFLSIGSLWNNIAYLIDLQDIDRIWRLVYNQLPINPRTFGTSLAMDEDFLFVGANESHRVFVYHIGCPADLNNDLTLSNGDVEQFLQLFASGDSVADLNQNGRHEFHDVSLFIQLYLDGCFEY